MKLWSLVHFALSQFPLWYYHISLFDLISHGHSVPLMSLASRVPSLSLSSVIDDDASLDAPMGKCAEVQGSEHRRTRNALPSDENRKLRANDSRSEKQRTVRRWSQLTHIYREHARGSGWARWRSSSLLANWVRKGAARRRSLSPTAHATSRGSRDLVLILVIPRTLRVTFESCVFIPRIGPRYFCWRKFKRRVDGFDRVPMTDQCMTDDVQ